MAVFQRTGRFVGKHSRSCLLVFLLAVSWHHAVADEDSRVDVNRNAKVHVSEEGEPGTAHVSPAIRQLAEPRDRFSLDQRRHGAVLLHCVGLLYMFAAIAIVCDECFVPALEVITDVLKLSPDVAGATFMAAGGSAPEFFTSLIGALVVESDIGTGTIIGSAVFNVLFVIGCCALIAPEPLQLTWFPLARDCAFYAVDLLVVTWTFLDERVYWYEALILFALYIVYTIFMTYSGTIEGWAKGIRDSEEVDPKENNWAGLCESSDQAALDANGSVAGSDDNNNIAVRCHSSSSTTSSSTERKRKIFRHKSITLQCKSSTNHVTGFRGPSLDVSTGENFMSDTGGTGDTGARHHLRCLTAPAASSEKVLVAVHVAASSTDGPAACLPGESELADVVPCGERNTKPEIQDNSSSAGTHDEDKGSENCAQPKTLDVEEEEQEPENEPLSLSPPGPGASIRDWIWYLVTLPIVFLLVFTVPDVRREGNKRYFVAAFIISILWIAAFTWVMVWLATVIAETCGLEEHIMGLTLLAAGTSVPDLLTSMLVARQGHGDMAISSSIGSNIFDVTIGLPIPWLLYAAVRGKPVVIKNEGLEISVALLFAMLAFTIGAIVCHGWVMTKWMGASLLFLYMLFEVVSVALTFAPEGSLKLIHV